MTEHVKNPQTKGPISEPKAAPATQKTQHRPGSNCFFFQHEDNVTKVKGPCTLKKTGEQLSNFLKAIKKNNGFMFNCPSKSCSVAPLNFRNLQNKGIRAKILLTVPRPGSPDNEKCPCGNLGKFCQAQILNFLWLDFLAAGCGQIRGRKSLKTPKDNFASPSPRFSFSLAGFFGGRLRPDKRTQVPENSLKQFRKPIRLVTNIRILQHAGLARWHKNWQICVA